MRFIDRHDELARLRRLRASREGGLAVVHGRRRIGKTRLLLEWTRGAGGVYTVADQSSPDVQRRYFALALGERLPGFGEIEYRDWRTLLTRLTREAVAAGWRGPLVFDELPYLVAAAPELPSVLQQWLDHEARAARLIVAVAGSSQRMMQGLALGSEAPLYGRAQEILEVGQLPPRYLSEVFGARPAGELVEAWTAWGGVPRYWELAAMLRGSTARRIWELVLDPMGPLHREPDHLLIEELPPAVEMRPVLDAIGAGAHRVSEIGGRVGRPATSLSRPLERLVGMGFVRREIPFGESERSSRRSLYRIADPFFRMWFRVVAPQRAFLAVASAEARARLLANHWPGLCAAAWEDLCRFQLPQVKSGPVERAGPFGPASRWWHGSLPEWDLVSESRDRRYILLGEAKWSRSPMSRPELERAVTDLLRRPPPQLPPRFAKHEPIRALFVPAVSRGVEVSTRDAVVVTAKDLGLDGG